MTCELYPLKDAIAALRNEIVEAVAQAEHEALKFGLGEIELEFAVVAKRELAGDAKLKFSILGIGAEAGGATKIGSEQTQKVRIKLSPHTIGPDGGKQPILVAGKLKQPLLDDN